MIRRLLSVFTLIGLAGPMALAQQAGVVPVLSGVFPPGATVGREVEWAISGRNLTKVDRVQVSGGGVEVIELAVKDEANAKVKVRVASDAALGFREVRLDGPSGLSNLTMIRVDRLDQVLEVEPNDEAEKAQVVTVGSAVVGVLKPLDLDHFRVEGTPGRRMTLDLEARRVGTSIAPVMTVFSTSGIALAQGRSLPGGDGDCRMSAVLPPEGALVVQIRDNVYGGNDLAKYRLRVDPAPFATGVFPLGGQAGETVQVELSGGNLTSPLRKAITLPRTPGAFVAVGDFESPDGPVASPGRLIVGDGPEITYPFRITDQDTFAAPPGATINGRIDKPGEVDTYTLPVKAGDKIRARVEADSLGSWLDSVLVIRDDKGTTLAENDDSRTSAAPDRPRNVSALGIPEPSPDSTVDYEAKADGFLMFDLTDRFGGGGPEYGYRLTIGPAKPDFSVTLLLGNANANARAMGNLNQVRAARTSVGQFGVFNLKPGSSVPINFQVTPEGNPGPIEVRVEGLPEGVTADPVAVRLSPPSGGGSVDAAPSSDFVLLKVESFALPGLFEFRIVASTKGTGPSLVEPFARTGSLDFPAFPSIKGASPPIVREASATIGVDTVAVSNRPITRVLTRFPLRIAGESRLQFVGPPSPPTLRSVGVPGPLLQGDRLDLTLDFSHAVTAEDGSSVEAVAEGVGLSAATVISAGTTVSDEEGAADVAVHVFASTKAALGPHVVKIAYTPPGGSKVEKTVTVEVKVPIEVKPATEAIFLKPGDSADFAVEVTREAGFDGEVELKLEGLPRGVKSKPVTVGTGMAKVEVRLEMNADAKPLEKPVELRVVGMARMPRGNVAVDSKIKAMLRPRPADK